MSELKVYTCEGCKMPCILVVEGVFTRDAMVCPLGMSECVWNESELPADIEQLQQLTHTEFYGECGGCGYCACHKKAQKLHYCKRGLSMDFISCGTTDENNARDEVMI